MNEPRIPLLIWIAIAITGFTLGLVIGPHAKPPPPTNTFCLLDVNNHVVDCHTTPNK